MKQAALYIRVSTEEQTEYSPEVQKEELLNYAHSHNYQVKSEHIFIDNGVSGKSVEKRSAFRSMIRLGKQKPRPFDIVLIHKFDRFARNKVDSVLYKALLKKEGIRVFSIKEPIPDDDKFAVIYESMLEAMAEYYSINLAEEVKKTMIKKAHLGEHQSIAPFGYRNEKKSFVIIPEEATIIKYIYQEFLTQGKSFLNIAKDINAMGIRTHKGNFFESRAIEYILKNPVYAGYARWTPTEKSHRNLSHPDSILTKSTHTPIISSKDFYEAQEKISKLKKKKHRNPSYSQTKVTQPWLVGMMVCGSCEHPLISSAKYKNGNVQLQCSNYNHGLCNISHSISTSKILPIIIKTLASFYENVSSLNYNICYRKKSSKNQQESMNQQLRHHNQKFIKAKDAYLNGIDSLDEYIQNKKIIQKEMNRIKQALLKLETQTNADTAPFPYHTLHEFLASSELTEEKKNVIANEIFQKIIYHKSTQTIEIYLDIAIS